MRKKKEQTKPAVYQCKNGRWVNVTQTGRPKFFRNGKWE